MRETKSKEKRNQVVDLAGIDSLRTLLWSRTVIERAGFAPSAILDRYNFQLSRIEFPLYAKAQRLPSVETLVDVEQAHPIGRNAAKERPFAGTRRIFELGPDGLPLWKVLEGATSTCDSVLDGWLTHRSHKPTGMDFPQKLWHLIKTLTPQDELEHIERLSSLPVGDRFTYETSMLAALGTSVGMDTYDIERLEVEPDLETVVAVLAAWQLSHERRTMRSEMDYLLIGVVSAFHQVISLIYAELSIWLHDRAKELIRARIPLES